MLSSAWIYDLDTKDWVSPTKDFNWSSYSDDALEYMWNFPLGVTGGAYLFSTEKINSFEVKFYNLISVSFFVLPNGEVVFPSTNRFVYTFEHNEDPVYLEEGVEYRRIDKKITLGLFKTIKEAREHAVKRTRVVVSLYETDDIITRSFEAFEDRMEPHDRVFEVYIPHINYTSEINCFNIDDMTMYNLYENKFEEFHRINVPFIKSKMKDKRHLFGIDLIADGCSSGLHMYIKKEDIESITAVTQKIKSTILDVFMNEVISTRVKYGVQDIPEELFDEDEEDTLT